MESLDVQGSSAVRELVAHWQSEDPFRTSARELREIQVQAMNDRLHEQRAKLKVLDRRAKDQPIDEIRSLQDVVPLLFSHTTYKSYPASFLTKKRWDMMTKWLGTLSTQAVQSVDLRNVSTADEWVKALRAAGHVVASSSGTTGHSSYLSFTRADIAVHKLNVARAGEAGAGVKPGPRFHYFFGGPRYGLTVSALQAGLAEEVYCKPGGAHYISNDAVTISDLDKLASIRRAIIEGTATAQMLAEAERDSVDRLEKLEKNIERFIGELFECHEPVVFFAGYSMIWRVAEAARARGISSGLLHPGSVVKTGGGMKGFKGSADFREQAGRVLGVPQEDWIETYGMTELTTQFAKCRHGRYHCPATVVLLMLDKAGEQLLDTSAGIVEGRGGFFDIVTGGHWGGVISGDRLKVDFGSCQCGRRSPSVLEVARYTDLPEGDDKLSCAGQIDSYVRGFAGGDWQE